MQIWLEKSAKLTYNWYCYLLYVFYLYVMGYSQVVRQAVLVRSSQVRILVPQPPRASPRSVRVSCAREASMIAAEALLI